MANFIKKHFDLIGYIALAIFFVILNYNLYINMDLLLDSDMASEMIYSKLLFDEKTLISNNWFFSTTIELINIPLIFMPLFLLTNNWHAIRIVGIVILDVILFLSFHYACKQLNIKHIPWLAFLILGSISFDYFYYVLRGSYYVPYISMTFLSIGLIIDISKSKKLINIKTLILIAISVFSSFSGIRQVVQCYACFFGTSIIVLLVKQLRNLFACCIDKEDSSYELLKLSSISFVSSIIGYLFYKLILEPKYIFKSVFDFRFIFASLSRICDIAYDCATLFGYQTGSIAKTIIAAVLLLVTIYMCLSILKRNENVYDLWIVILYVCMLFVTTCIFVFTDMLLATRYYLLAQTCLVLVLGVYNKEGEFTSIIVCVFAAVLSIVLTFSQLNVCLENSTNKDLICINNELIKQGCYNGYGSFWYANVFTELSDGEIEAWSYRSKDKNKENVDVDNLYMWLQKKEHINKYPSRKTFLVLSNNEQNNVRFVKDVSENIYYAGKDAVLYIFDDYHDLFEALNVQ